MHLLIFSIILGCCEIEITTAAFISLRKMERTLDVLISRSCKIEDEFRKMEGVQCIEWNIENFKSLLEEKRLECITSPTFQMRGARWNLSFRHTKEELYLVEWKTEKQRHSFTYLLTVTDEDGDVFWSLLETFLRDESKCLVSEKCLCVLNFSASSMTVNNLRVSFIFFPEMEQRYSDAFKEGVAMGAETDSNSINREGRSETTENLVKIISPSSEMESIRILPGCQTDNFRIIDGLLCFEWNIKNYKSLAKKQLDLMTSPSFQMRGAMWNLLLKHTEKVVTPILYRWEYASASESKQHSVTYQMAIQRKEDTYRSDLKTFLFNKSKCTAAGVSARLEFLSKYRTSDNLRVFCIIFPEDLERTSEATSDSGVRGVETSSKTSHEGIDILSSNLKDLFLKEENCDFVIKIKGRDFHVHRAILAARSPVLSAMLQHDMTEKNNSTTSIDDCEPDVFELFLSYLYSGRVKELSWSHATHLYTLGDKYDMPHLRKECLQFMEGNLSIEAFCDAIALAVKHNEKTLVKCAEEFFLKNVKSILVTNEWQLLLQNNPFICNELFLNFCK